MELEKWAMGQLNKLGMTEDKKKQYEKVLSVFCGQGHSGFSADYLLRYVNMYVEKGYDEVKAKLDGMLNKVDDEDNMQQLITNDILDVINAIKDYGFEKEDALNISRLMNWKPIMPLTGEDDEWGESLSWKEDTQQNKLCSAVFRENHDNSTAHWVDGRVYSDNGGHSWFTTKRGALNSSIPVTFPFMVPDKPEFVYLNGEDSEEIVTDKERIKELYDEWDKSFID